MNIPVALVILVVLPIALLGGGRFYAKYLGIRPGGGLSLLLAIGGFVAATTWLCLTRGECLRPVSLAETWGWGFPGAKDVSDLLQVISYYVALMLLLVLVAKLYMAVVMNRATAEERLPDGRGFRAWLRPLSLWMGVVAVLGAYMGMDWPIWTTGFGVLGLLLAYPAVNSVLCGGSEERAVAEQDLAEERRRVLALVETGKVSGEDGAELIAALGQSRGTTEESSRMSVGRRVMLVGGLLLLVGLCLTWFKLGLNLGPSGVIGNQVLHLQGWAPRAQFGVKAVEIQGADYWFQMTVRAGDLKAGMGWIIVGLGMSVAALPLIWAVDAKSRRIHRGISVAAMGAGSVLLLYVVSGVLSAGQGTIQAGLFLVMAGYAVLWAGVAREYLKVSVGGGERREPAII